MRTSEVILMQQQNCYSNAASTGNLSNETLLNFDVTSDELATRKLVRNDFNMQ
jgi:hypothetical protein